MTNPPRYSVQATNSSFQLIEALGKRGTVGVTDLARELDMSKSGVHNHLSTLRHLGYVRKEPDGYALSLRFLWLGERARDRRSIYQAAKSKVHNLAKTSGEAVALIVEEEGDAICILGEYNNSALEYGFAAGELVPLHASAAGKAILAYLSADRVRTILDRTGLPRLTERTVTDREKLLEQLDGIRDDGIAFCHGERIQNVHGVAIPITETNNLVGVVTVFGQSSSMSGRRLEEDITGQVISTANAIEVELQSE